MFSYNFFTSCEDLSAVPSSNLLWALEQEYNYLVCFSSQWELGMERITKSSWVWMPDTVAVVDIHYTQIAVLKKNLTCMFVFWDPFWCLELNIPALSAMLETLVQFLGREDLLEKGQATHSSILALRLWRESVLSLKESASNTGDLGSIPGLGRSPGEGKGCPLQCSGLENSMDCIVHGVAKSQTRLSNFNFHTCLGAQGAFLPCFCWLQKQNLFGWEIWEAAYRGYWQHYGRATEPQAIWQGMGKMRGEWVPIGRLSEIWSPKAGFVKETCVLRMLENNTGGIQVSGDKLQVSGRGP